MDFERLGEALINDSVDDNDNYSRVDRNESQRIGRFDFEKAKAFLSVINERLSISLYDHLADVVKTILRSKIPDAFDKLEEISLDVKKMRHKPESDLTEVFEIPEDLLTFVKEKEIFYKFKTSFPETDEVKVTVDEDDEEEEESDEEDADAIDADSLEVVVEEPDLSEVLPDTYYVMSRFNEAGIGLSLLEVFELTVALKDLAVQFKLKKIKFWGKIFGIKKDYYIAEAPYQEGIVQENFGWEDHRISMKKSEETLEEKEKDEEEEDDEEDKVDEEPEEEEEEEEGEEEEKKEKDKVKIPPIPEPKQKMKQRIPAEKNGTGVNEYVYFVCTKLGEPWRILPFMLPSHISEARYLKRFFMGDLEAQIKGCVFYPGKEAHYLRAQIARITATTWIAPSGFYKSAAEKDDEEEEDEEEEKDANEIVLNTKFESKSIKNLFSEGVEGWCHYRKAILYQGRCIPMKTGEKDEGEEAEEEEAEAEDEDEEKAKEEDDPEIIEAIIETQVPILRSLSKDKGIGRLKPWSMKLSSKLVEEKAILIIYSYIWPGAYTFYDGKNFEHIYIGHGFKYSVFHYAPPIRVGFQSEYKIGDDVIEPVDEEILPKEEIEEIEEVEGDEKEEIDGNEEEEEDEDQEKD